MPAALRGRRFFLAGRRSHHGLPRRLVLTDAEEPAATHEREAHELRLLLHALQHSRVGMFDAHIIIFGW